MSRKNKEQQLIKVYNFQEDLYQFYNLLSTANERIRRFEYYGIEYNNLDGGELAESKKEKDRDEARILILMGKEIPKDLEERLLRYKAEDERSTNESK